MRLSAYLAIGGVVLLVVAFILRRFHHAPAPAAGPVATPAPSVPVSEPESLAAPPTEASFTPSGPPALPAAPAAAPAASTAETAKTVKPKTPKKKPASTKRKKKK